MAIVNDEMRRVVREYSSQTQTVIREALSDNDLLNIAGFAPITGLLNGLMSVTVQTLRSADCDINEAVNMLEAFYNHLDDEGAADE